jgi:hypothetical protein
MSVRLLAPLSLSVSLSACYGAAPPKPPVVPLPSIDLSAQLIVNSESKTTIENVTRTASSCPAGRGEGDPSCVVTRYTEAAPVTRLYTTARLGDEPLNYAQFKAITDPKWNDKMAELDGLSRRCKRANIPRYLGMGLLAVGVIALETSTNNTSGPNNNDGGAGSYIAVGGLGGGVASYLLGYFAFGGRDCNKADSLYRYLNTTDEMAWTSVTGPEHATEMRELADRFNSTRGRHDATAGGPAAMRMRQ